MKITSKMAKKVGDEIGIDWKEVDLKQFIMGLRVEMEHGSKLGKKTNVTEDDLVKTGRIALAHLEELPDYYTKLKTIEENLVTILDLVLTEAKIDTEIAKFKTKNMPEMISFLETVKLEKIKPKYYTWLIKQATLALKKDSANFVNFVKHILELINQFDYYTTNKIILGKDSDINGIKNVDELENFIKEKTKSREGRSAALEAEKVFENENFIVLHPKTTEASCKYGKGTRWCISGKTDNKFDEYTKEEGLKFLFLINKITNDKDAILIDPGSYAVEIYDKTDDTRETSYISTKYPKDVLESVNRFIKTLTGTAPFVSNTFEEQMSLSVDELLNSGGKWVSNFFDVDDLTETTKRIKILFAKLKSEEASINLHENGHDFIEKINGEISKFGVRVVEEYFDRKLNKSNPIISSFVEVILNEKYKLNSEYRRDKWPYSSADINSLLLLSLAESINGDQEIMAPLILGEDFKQSIDNNAQFNVLIKLDSIIFKMSEKSYDAPQLFNMSSQVWKDILYKININKDANLGQKREAEKLSVTAETTLKNLYSIGEKINWDLIEYSLAKFNRK